MPLLTRRRVIGRQAMISQVRLKRGCKVPTHQHPNEQFACILEGSLRFGIGEEGRAERFELVALAGDIVTLPSNVPHSAEALEDTLVLDVFSPPSATTGIDPRPLSANR
jgi:quercetin dioxygenase-like cupin family protein